MTNIQVRIDAVAGAVVIGLVVGLVSWAVRGCWSDSVQDYELTRRMREWCAEQGGIWMPVEGTSSDHRGCFTVRSVPVVDSDTARP